MSEEHVGIMRYFFEIVDGCKSSPDSEGTEMASAALAREEALRTLGEKVRYEMPDGDHREFAVRVTDEHHRPVVSANISLMVTYPADRNS